MANAQVQADPVRVARWYFGGLASAGAACCTHPLDLLKVRVTFYKNIASLLINGLYVQMFGELGVSCKYALKR